MRMRDFSSTWYGMRSMAIVRLVSEMETENHEGYL